MELNDVWLNVAPETGPEFAVVCWPLTLFITPVHDFASVVTAQPGAVTGQHTSDRKRHHAGLLNYRQQVSDKLAPGLNHPKLAAPSEVSKRQHLGPLNSKLPRDLLSPLPRRRHP